MNDEWTTWDGLPISRSKPYGTIIVVYRAAATGYEFLALHRAEPGPSYEGDWAWTPPSGARLPDEPVETCARRELAEETGLDLPIRRATTSGETWAVFVAEAPDTARVVLDAEHDRFAWLSVDELLTRCRPEQVADQIREAISLLDSEADRGFLGPPVDVEPVLRKEREALLRLLADLDDDDWCAPTPCPSWSAHQLMVHLVHDDLRRISGDRDGHTGAWVDASSFDELVVGLDRLNEQWVEAMTPTLSPRLTRELLQWLAGATEEHLLGLDPDALETSVAWAGSGPHPNWLDVAREYTERWVHQQQLRDAVGRPGVTDEEFVAPVVETFARGLPTSLPQPDASSRSITVRVTGPFERSWTLESGPSGWRFSTTAGPADTLVELPVDAFWRRAVRMIGRDEVENATNADGDRELVGAVLDLRAAIVPDLPPP